MKRIYACILILATLLLTALYSSRQVQRFADSISGDLDHAVAAVRDRSLARLALRKGADRCDRMREKMNHLLPTADFTELEAALRAEAGMKAEDIVKELETDIVPNVDASFIIDRLDYMAKGGRCSTVTMLGANVLQLKPCIEVVDGKMRVGTKYRGSFEKCIQKYVKDRLEGREDIRNHRIFITHPHCPEGDVETAREAIEKYQSFDEIIETHAGCTVSSHCGPRTLGVLFIRK